MTATIEKSVDLSTMTDGELSADFDRYVNARDNAQQMLALIAAERLRRQQLEIERLRAEVDR